MLNYFGRKQDLTCIQVRILYEYLVSFYIKLFIDKMYNLTRIDIKKLSDGILAEKGVKHGKLVLTGL